MRPNVHFSCNLWSAPVPPQMGQNWAITRLLSMVLVPPLSFDCIWIRPMPLQYVQRDVPGGSVRFPTPPQMGQT